MTMEKLYEVLSAIGYPCAYGEFEGQPESIPFIAYVNTGRRLALADDSAWEKINSIRVELYTEGKDLEAERAVEEVLEEHEIMYRMEEVGFIEDEEIYEVYFEFEI